MMDRKKSPPSHTPEKELERARKQKQKGRRKAAPAGKGEEEEKDVKVDYGMIFGQANELVGAENPLRDAKHPHSESTPRSSWQEFVSPEGYAYSFNNETGETEWTKNAEENA